MKSNVLRVLKIKAKNIKYVLEFYAFYIASKSKDIFRTYDKLKKNNIDVINLNRIYNNILEELVKLIKELELENPIEVFEFVNYILNNYYLSYDKKKHMSVDEKKETANIYYALGGAVTLNNHGVCRHRSIFLQNLFQLLGYKSDIVCGVANKYKQVLGTITEEMITNLKTDEEIADAIEKRMSYIDIPVEVNPYIGNHVITRVLHNGKIAFIDANIGTHFCKKDDCLRSKKGYKFTVSKGSTPENNKKFGIKKIDDIYEIVDEPDYLEAKERVCDIIENNQELLINFNEFISNMLYDAEVAYNNLYQDVPQKQLKR